MYLVELKEYANNRGITSFKDRKYGNLDPLSQLSLPESQIKEKIIFNKNGYDVPFKFILNESFDNIVLENQCINLQPKVYSDIFFVGTCNNGSYYHDILLKNETSSSKYKLYLSDFNSEDSINKEICFKHFDYMHDPEGKNEYIAPKLWFFHMSINNMFLNEIQFGYNPFIHIFSITMKEA